MIPYFVLLLFILMFGLLIQPSKDKQRNRIFLWTSFFVMVLLSGLRATSVGTDTETYTTLFRYIDFYDFESSRYEIGFLQFLKTVHFISDNPTVLYFISSIICVGAVCLLVYRYSSSPLMSILLYILLKPYFFQMTGMRQSLALAFIVLAFLNVDKKASVKRVVVDLLLIVFACMIHNMSIVALIPFAMFICPGFYKFSKQTATKVFRITALVAVLGFVFYGVTMKIVSVVAPKYALYFSGTWSNSNYSAALFKMLIQVVFMLVGVLYLKNKPLTKEESFVLIMMSLSVITSVLAMRMTIWGRLTGTFSLYNIIWVPMFTSVVKRREDRVALDIGIVLFALMYMIITFAFRPEWDGVVPYMFMKR